MPLAAPAIVTACGEPQFFKIAVSFCLTDGKVIHKENLMLCRNPDGSFKSEWVKVFGTSGSNIIAGILENKYKGTRLNLKKVKL